MPPLPAAMTLDQLNSLESDSFEAALAAVFEHGDWIARAAAGGRPYTTVAALHDGMLGVLRRAPRDRQVEFLRGHPELGSKAARGTTPAGDLTDASRAEQGQLGLDRLSGDEHARFERLNAE